MSKHTPGPWNNVGFVVYGDPAQKKTIGSANPPGPGGDWDIALKDATLMAAAPEMLETLKLTLSYLAHRPDIDRKVRDTIRKAEGA